MAKEINHKVNKLALFTWSFTGLVIIALVVFIATRPPSDNSEIQGIEISKGDVEVEPSGLADFTLTDLNGGSITLADYRGDKPVILDFWATWCPNCRRDMPVMNRLYEKYQDDIEVIAINLQESERTVRKFIESRGLTFPVVFDPSGRVSRAFGIRYTNVHVFIGKNGEILSVKPGDITESDFRALIN